MTKNNDKLSMLEANTDVDVNADLNNNNSQESRSSQVTDEQVINWIKSRRSIGNLTIPAPSQEQVKQAVECAMTAPDHKKLQPWRFIVVEKQARHELGRALLAAAEAKAVRDGAELNEKTTQKTLKMPLRAPMIIAVVTKMQYHEKVPAFEQLLSAGAAVQNLILALKAQGFSTVWRTGTLSNEPSVKSYFNVGFDDYIVAFVYVGTAHCQMPDRKDVDSSDFIRFES